MKKTTKKIKDNSRLALGKEIKEKRESKSMSQETLALIIGSTQNRIPEIESGKTKNIDTYIACLNALGGQIKIEWK